MAEVPPGVVTVTLTAPVPAGLTAMIWVAELISKPGDGVEPNSGADAFDKFVPVMVTTVPPAAAPEVGLIDVMVGAWTGDT